MPVRERGLPRRLCELPQPPYVLHWRHLHSDEADDKASFTDCDEQADKDAGVDIGETVRALQACCGSRELMTMASSTVAGSACRPTWASSWLTQRASLASLAAALRHQS